MRVTFIIPFPAPEPSGGVRVVYEYANGLVARGHGVTVVHTLYERQSGLSLRTLKRPVHYAGRRIGIMRGGYRPDSWLRVDSQVDVKLAITPHQRWVPDSDVVVATLWNSAEWVSGYPEQKGRKFYLIQDQESFFTGFDPARVMNTWQLPLRKIVIARWLKEVAEELGESAIYIPNGLNFDDFGLDVPPYSRDPASLIMLYHDMERKGSLQGLEAMHLVREKVPHLKVTLFGVPDRPEHLPGWISYYRRPSRGQLRELYNEAAVFVGPSLVEGWGLPGCEAAQCGAALCMTDVGGHREYALHERTALLSPPKDHKAMADNILRLIRNDALRLRLSAHGHEYIQCFTWNQAVEKIEQTFMEAIEE